MPALKLNYSVEEKAAWRVAADRLHLPLTTWIRLQLNAAVPAIAPAEPKKYAGRPKATVEDFLAKRRVPENLQAGDGVTRWTTVYDNAKAQQLGRADDPLLHALYEKCARAAWRPGYTAMRAEDLVEFYAELNR